MKPTPAPTRPKSLDDLVGSDLVPRLESLDVASRKVFAGKLRGERRSKKRGESVEFADHRPYAVGDDLRHIDWNIFARLDALFLKLFLEEEDLSLHLVLDASASSDCGVPNKFVFQQRLAMALGYIGLVNHNRVACSVIGGLMQTPGSTDDFVRAPLHSLRDLRGRRRTHDLSRFLCSLEPEQAHDASGPQPRILFPEAAKRIALSRRGRGVMVILSDFLMKEGYADALRMLVGRGYDLFAIQVLSPQEMDPTGEHGVAGDLRLKDVEDGDKAEVTISAPLLKRYSQNLSAYTGRLRNFCSQRDIKHVLVQSDANVESLVMDVLRRRGLVA